MRAETFLAVAAAFGLGFALNSKPVYGGEKSEAEETKNQELVKPVDRYFRVITKREVRELEKVLPEKEAEEYLTGKVMLYPEDWAELTRKRRKLLEPEEEEWRKKYRDKLEQKVSFRFRETKLEDVLNRVRDETGLNVVLDQKEPLQKYRDYEVSLELADIKLKYALNWILRPISLAWTLHEGTIFISDLKTVKSAREKAKVPVLYDVLELTIPIPDYIAPSMDSIRRPRRKDFWSDEGFEKAWARYERARFGTEIMRPPRIMAQDLVSLVRHLVREEEATPEEYIERLIETKMEKLLKEKEEGSEK